MVPCGLRLDVSMWSADLANLEREILRLAPLADSFHFDVADGVFAPSLLFFPDLIARLRPLTAKPFHLHLMVMDPARWAAEFRQAGADWITTPVERGFIETDGLAINLETPVSALEPFLPRLQRIVMMGTAIGVKGKGLDPRALDRMAEAKRLIAGRQVKIYADGGIRDSTVDALRQAGADAIVPGSLLFGSRDLAATAARLKSGEPYMRGA